MTRHPSEDLIVTFAAGRQRPGVDLVMRAHLARCALCRAHVRDLEALGGAMLETEEPAPVAPDALDRALAAIERRPSPEPPAPPPILPTGEGAALPPALKGLRLGRRRRVAPGMWMTPVAICSSEKLYLLGIAPGVTLPRHTHRGSEHTAVLKGRFTDGSADYGPGDFVSADEAVDHRLAVVGDEVCICLVATDRRLVMRDPIGWLTARIAGL